MKKKTKKKTINYYGFWVYNDAVPLASEPVVYKGDVVKVIHKEVVMLEASFIRENCTISFNKWNIDMGYFIRKSKSIKK